MAVPTEEVAPEAEAASEEMTDEDLDAEIAELEGQLESTPPEEEDDDAELDELLSDLEQSPTAEAETEDEQLRKIIDEL
jgi:hypothetical protein